MNYSDYMGFYPVAPVVATGQPANNAQAQTAVTNSQLAQVFTGQALAVDFAVSGWLIGGILALALLRILSELAE